MQTPQPMPEAECRKRQPSDVVYCAVAEHELTVATAHTDHHYRAGDFSGDYPEDHPEYIAPVRPDNAAICASCGNCQD
jgi:hypothetical protein